MLCRGGSFSDRGSDGIDAAQPLLVTKGYLHADGSKWEPPAEGTWKLNRDAAFLPSTGDTAAGIIARTHQGVVALAGGQQLLLGKCAEEIEMAAVLHGLNVLSKYYRGSDCA